MFTDGWTPGSSLYPPNLSFGGLKLNKSLCWPMTTPEKYHICLISVSHRHDNKPEYTRNILLPLPEAAYTTKKQYLCLTFASQR